MLDNNFFKSTAWYYARYRRPYPKKLFENIVEHYHLAGQGRLLDLGCGTGEITIPLAPHFKEAIGLDPEEEMLNEAMRKAAEENVRNIVWMRARAEEIGPPMGMFRLTTMGVSFHWFDQELVLAKVYELTESGGGTVIIGDISPVWDSIDREEWKLRRQEIIEKYLGKERRAGDSFYVPPKKRYEQRIDESPFQTFQKATFDYSTNRTIDDIIGFLYSTSYASKRLLGDKADDFEREMREELFRLEPSGKFIEKGKLEIFFLHK